MLDHHHSPYAKQKYVPSDPDIGKAVFDRRPSVPEGTHASHDNRRKSRRPSLPTEKSSNPYDISFMKLNPFHPRPSIDNGYAGRRPSHSTEERPYTAHDATSNKSSFSSSHAADAFSRRPSAPVFRPRIPFGNPPLKSGLVLCKNAKSTFLSQWKRRELVLRETALEFCNTKTGKSVLTIDLASVAHVGRSEHLTTGFCITYGSSKKEMACQVQNDTVLYEWVDAIYEHSPKLSLISDPVNFQHDVHVDLDPHTGDFVGLPAEWEKLLRAQLLTKADYHENPQAFIEAMEFYTKGLHKSSSDDNDHSLSMYRSSGQSSSSDSIYSIYTDGESSPEYELNPDLGRKHSYPRRDSSRSHQYPSDEIQEPPAGLPTKETHNRSRSSPATQKLPFTPSRAPPAVPKPLSSTHGLPRKHASHQRGESAPNPRSTSPTKQLLNKVGSIIPPATRLHGHKSPTSSPKLSFTARDRPSSPHKLTSESLRADSENSMVDSIPKHGIQKANPPSNTSNTNYLHQFYGQKKPRYPDVPPVPKNIPSAEQNAPRNHPSLAVDPLNLSKNSIAFNSSRRPPPTTTGGPPRPPVPELPQKQAGTAVSPSKPPAADAQKPVPKRGRRVDPKVAEERDRKALQDLKQVVSQDTNDPYQVFKPGRQLGSGASGTVWAARFIDPVRTAQAPGGSQFVKALAQRNGYRPCVALKEMDISKQPRKQLIVNEIITMRSSRHMNIVNFVSSYFSADERRLWIVMELMETSLTYLIDKNPHISEEQMARITLEVSRHCL